MEWPTREQLLRWHKFVTGLAVSAVDSHKLDGALSRPLTDVFGRVLYPTIWDKAACLIHSIATTHPFTEDGNKRMAWVAGAYVLRANGYRMRASIDDAERLVYGVVAKEIEIPALSAWLHDHSRADPGPGIPSQRT